MVHQNKPAPARPVEGLNPKSCRFVMVMKKAREAGWEVGSGFFIHLFSLFISFCFHQDGSWGAGEKVVAHLLSSWS